MNERNHGVDIARGLALLGIVYAHLGDRQNTWLYYFGNGIAPALFALLAGFSMVNFSRDTTKLPHIIRGVLFILLGLSLGLITNSIFIILVQFGILFMLGAFLLTAPKKYLFYSSVIGLGVTPIVSFGARHYFSYSSPENISFTTLAHPLEAFLNLFLIGPYPLLFWACFFVFGMSLNMIIFTGKKGLLVGLGSLGLGLSLLLGSIALLQVTSIQEALNKTNQPWSVFYSEQRGGLFGVFPKDGSFYWLIVYFPHSGSIIELFIATALSLAVLTFCINGYRWLAQNENTKSLAEGFKIFFGLGSISLTVYTLHVLMNTSLLPPGENYSHLREHYLTLVIIGAFFSLMNMKGPLELIERKINQMIVRLVRK